MAENEKTGGAAASKAPPAKQKPPKKSLGVGRGTVRRSPDRDGRLDERTGTAYTAGEASELFPAGGTAFAVWCAEQGIDPAAKKPLSAWAELLDQFAARPVHGHRRQAHGGNHKPNPSDLRR